MRRYLHALLIQTFYTVIFIFIVWLFLQIGPFITWLADILNVDKRLIVLCSPLFLIYFTAPIFMTTYIDNNK